MSELSCSVFQHYKPNTRELHTIIYIPRRLHYWDQISRLLNFSFLTYWKSQISKPPPKWIFWKIRNIKSACMSSLILARDQSNCVFPPRDVQAYLYTNVESSSSYSFSALYPFKFDLGFPHDRRPFYSVPSFVLYLFTSIFLKSDSTSSLHLNLRLPFPPSLPTSNFFLSFHHPFLQYAHTIAIDVLQLVTISGYLNVLHISCIMSQYTNIIMLKFICLDLSNLIF
jgi:hypothetical protein